ncbi:MAG: endopeptidase La [Deltaproteobacteria bacterium]|nr:endopeptidase La [Deltaproteobacteria bacterium]
MTAPEILSILPLRNSVLFPASVVPINVGRPRSVRLIEDAFGREHPTIAVVAQRASEIEEPTFDDLYTVGTLARVVKVIKLGASNYSVVLQGLGRLRLEARTALEPYLRARVVRMPDDGQRDVELDALGASLRESARHLVDLMPNLPREAAAMLDSVGDPGTLADVVASNLPVPTAAKQKVLEAVDLCARVRACLSLVTRQLEILRVKKEISTLVQEEISKSQREYLLRQQLRAIRQELGESDSEDDELDALRERIARAELPTDAERAAKKQLARLRSMQPQSAEYQVTRTYVEWLADLPWAKASPERLDIAEVRRVLDEDHYGLERIKRRIIEFIAVRKVRRDKRGPILCFVGPPGVGKTSLGRSIARATGRNFVRISLGGVRDEAEVRGHRRTYVGALPGRIIAGLKKAGTRNPVFVLDEIDKMGVDFAGDPAAALLEVLDPEQNFSFADHYLEVPFDLSQVMFIGTANTSETIPAALLDRMEVIRLAGYTRVEKKAIARGYIVPRALSGHGLTTELLSIPEDALDVLVDEYTREPGVRQLEKHIASLCRAAAVRIASGDTAPAVVDHDHCASVLGRPRHEKPSLEPLTQTGVAPGMVWTAAGGDIRYVESTRMPGRGEIHLTGKMDDVVRESATTAFSYLRSRTAQLGVPEEFLKKSDVHIHAPSGTLSADAPGTGLAILISVASLLTNRRARADVAVTGEITLRGLVLPVEGVKEKILAAHRAGVRQVIMPRRNLHDLDEVPRDIRDDLQFHLISKVAEAIDLCLEAPPPPEPPEPEEAAAP